MAPCWTLLTWASLLCQFANTVISYEVKRRYAIRQAWMASHAHSDVQVRSQYYNLLEAAMRHLRDADIVLEDNIHLLC